VYFLAGSPTDTMLLNFSKISSSLIFFFRFSDAALDISGPAWFLFRSRMGAGGVEFALAPCVGVVWAGLKL
jgi:hypothetical protein